MGKKITSIKTDAEKEAKVTRRKTVPPGTNPLQHLIAVELDMEHQIKKIVTRLQDARMAGSVKELEHAMHKAKRHQKHLADCLNGMMAIGTRLAEERQRKLEEKDQKKGKLKSVEIIKESKAVTFDAEKEKVTPTTIPPFPQPFTLGYDSKGQS